ncbi:MAG: AraC family transcriptional regulator [Bacteroidales bacterium]|jgi:AraC-like DNA-binding protein|nr:AraC family transcriptional regulator [Bacteroidales bacterium]
MKIIPSIRIKYSLATIDIANEEVPFFYNPLHYHPELELKYVEQSSGTRFVGDSIEPFGPGDLCLIGARTPHLWKNEMVKDVLAKAVVIKFLPDFVGNHFYNIPEMSKLRHLIFDLAPYGLRVEGKLRDSIAPKMKQMMEMSPALQITRLLEILCTVAESTDWRILSKLQMSSNGMADNKTNFVLSYLQKNFNQEISLKKIAEKAYMHPNSLCTHFKRETGKTIFNSLNEIRLKQACNLLISTNDSIAVISGQVGYVSQRLFNKKFMEIIGMTPLRYRKKMMVNNIDE